VVNFGCLVQGCEILINPLFYCTKFREELEFEVRYEFPPWLPFLKKKINKCLRKKRKKNTKEKNLKAKKRNEKKKNGKKKKAVSFGGNVSYF